ncbi:MAG: hypothetical protein PHN71_06340, partial [Candidatus Cloacimonetes bacterium]|nr:hypothetical protein [Candidatus Cloacimonadota bacterium]
MATPFALGNHYRYFKPGLSCKYWRSSALSHSSDCFKHLDEGSHQRLLHIHIYHLFMHEISVWWFF